VAAACMSRQGRWSQLVADVAPAGGDSRSHRRLPQPNRERAADHARDPAAAIGDGGQDVNRVGVAQKTAQISGTDLTGLSLRWQRRAGRGRRGNVVCSR
jgi:hypothetical protein